MCKTRCPSWPCSNLVKGTKLMPIQKMAALTFFGASLVAHASSPSAQSVDRKTPGYETCSKFYAKNVAHNGNECESFAFARGIAGTCSQRLAYCLKTGTYRTNNGGATSGLRRE